MQKCVALSIIWLNQLLKPRLSRDFVRDEFPIFPMIHIRLLLLTLAHITKLHSSNPKDPDFET